MFSNESTGRKKTGEDVERCLVCHAANSKKRKRDIEGEKIGGKAEDRSTRDNFPLIELGERKEGLVENVVEHYVDIRRERALAETKGGWGFGTLQQKRGRGKRCIFVKTISRCVMDDRAAWGWGGGSVGWRRAKSPPTETLSTRNF